MWNAQGPLNRKYCVPAPTGTVTVSVLPICTGGVVTLAQEAVTKFVVDCSWKVASAAGQLREMFPELLLSDN
jgi:hypothetical protein